MLLWTVNTQMSLRLRPGDSGCNYIFPYDVMSDYSKNFASMSFVQKCPIGTYVAIAMRVIHVRSRRTVTGDPYLEVMGVDTEGLDVCSLRLWRHEEGDIRPGGAYVVRGLKVVNARTWDSSKGVWRWESQQTIACSVRTAVEDVSDVDTITQYL